MTAGRLVITAPAAGVVTVTITIEAPGQEVMVSAETNVGRPKIKTPNVGPSRGGLATAAGMTPQQRKVRAQKAAAARWGKNNAGKRGYA